MDILAALAAGLAVVLVCWPFCRAKREQLQGVRARLLAQKSWDRRQGLLQSLAPNLGLAAADRLCQYAGRPWGMTGLTLLQVQCAAALLMLALFAAIHLGLAAFFAVLTWFMPRILLSSLAQQRRARIALELPAFLDLWGLLVAAGEGVEAALIEICRRHPDWQMSSEVRRAVDRMLASGLFGESLVEEAKLTGSAEFTAVAEQVRHLADGGGVPSKELGKMAEQMREQRVAELMQSAGAMAVVGIFPKMGAIFLSLAPVVATIVITAIRQI